MQWCAVTDSDMGYGIPERNAKLFNSEKLYDLLSDLVDIKL